MRAVAVARIALLILNAVVTLHPASFSQSRGTAASGTEDGSESGLIRAADGEQKRGINLFYTQNYRSAGRPVRFSGSLYAGITAFTVNKCNLTIGTNIVDRYSGQIGKGTIKNTQSSYQYSVEFVLTTEIADALRLTEARPNQLENGTNPVCADRRACTIYWLELRAKRPVMKLTSITNDIAGYDGFIRNFDGMVEQFWVPISSSDAGKELISKLQSFAITCRQ
ncbi:MAG TPA: hypothetical protein VGT08_11855 [Terracidiphilus sp.]|nr:hypothetical protein [Terracidiphilus sp.]